MAKENDIQIPDERGIDVPSGDDAASAHGEHPVREISEIQALFLTYSHSRDPRLRDLLVHRHMHIVHYLARKYANRGESMDDLIGVGTIGLLKAIDRFDPTRGFQFSTFAVPTILGEIKREFRDRGWAIRVPRKLQEIHLLATSAIDDLSVTLQRNPTIVEIADKIDATVEDTIESLEIGSLYTLMSLDSARESSDDGGEPIDAVGDTDGHFQDLELASELEQALLQLPKRERMALLLRFFKGWTQSQIAETLQVSQMHVSRLQAKAQKMLRDIMRESDDAAA